MNNRLLQFLAAENISQSQLADALGVARASISHIISGRNKPGFDFIESMMTRFPALNIEWLITGNGKMYKTADRQPQTTSQKPVQADDPDLFSASFEGSTSNANQTTETQNEFQAGTTTTPVQEDNLSNSPTPLPNNQRITEINTLVKMQQQTNNKRIISKIIVYYSDNTFSEIL